MKIITLLSGVLVTNVLSTPCYTQICSLASAVGNCKFLLMAQFHTETKFCVLHIILIVGLNIWAFFWDSAHPPCTLEGLYSFGTSLTILSRPPEPPLSPSSAGLPRTPLPRSAQAALPPPGPNSCPHDPSLPSCFQTWTSLTSFMHTIILVCIYTPWHWLSWYSRMEHKPMYLICQSAFVPGCLLHAWLLF